MTKYIVFSDVDGTLAHYPSNLEQEADGDGNGDGNGLIILPPSKTGTRGVLSKRTLELCHALRRGSVASSSPSHADSPQRQSRQTPLVLISGMRTTTLFQRLPYLPKADAYVSESGGRIFYPVPIDDESKATHPTGAVENLVIQPITTSDSPKSSSFTLVEDLEWRAQISDIHAAGPDGFDYNDIPIDQRKGKLWDYGRQLTKQGYKLDTLGYATAFRINRKMQSGELLDNFDEFIKQCINSENMPNELGCSTNLGCVDVYPIMSGKKNCCEYLVRRFLGQDAELRTRAFCMCDDDNDIEMAVACKTAFLPSVTSDSIRRMVELQKEDSGLYHSGKLVVTEDVEKGIVETAATERALELILKEVESDDVG
jgi:hydroxymethylpyrimidine pyrophosphatase-like HAD family hydrolase